MTQLDHIQTELLARTSLANVNRLPSSHSGMIRMLIESIPLHFHSGCLGGKAVCLLS